MKTYTYTLVIEHRDHDGLKKTQKNTQKDEKKRLFAEKSMQKDTISTKLRFTSHSLPDTAFCGLKVQKIDFSQEEKGSPSPTVSEFFIIPHEDDDSEYGAYTQVLSTSWLYISEDLRVKLVPEVESEKLDYCMQIADWRKKWNRFYTAFLYMCKTKPHITILLILTGVGLMFLGLVSLLNLFIGFRTCRSCLSFDREEGLRELNRITHEFDGNQVEQMNIDIAQMMSSERGIKTLNPTRVGYCSTKQTLLEDTLPKCNFYKEGVA